MDYGDTIRHGRLSYLYAHTPLPGPAELALRVAVTVTKWTQRHRTRQALKRLEAHRLADIGKSAEAAWREAALPFWRD